VLRGDVTGPRLLGALLRRLEARGRYIAWEDIDRIEDGVVHLTRRLDELARLTGR
jgi:hypothetical protein